MDWCGLMMTDDWSPRPISACLKTFLDLWIGCPFLTTVAPWAAPLIISPWISHLHEAHPLNLFGLKKRVPGNELLALKCPTKTGMVAWSCCFFVSIICFYICYSMLSCLSFPLRFLCFLGAPRMLGHDAREAIIANMVHLCRHEEIGFVPFREQSPNSDLTKQTQQTQRIEQSLLSPATQWKDCVLFSQSHTLPHQLSHTISARRYWSPDHHQQNVDCPQSFLAFKIPKSESIVNWKMWIIRCYDSSPS